MHVCCALCDTCMSYFALKCITACIFSFGFKKKIKKEIFDAFFGIKLRHYIVFLEIKYTHA